MDTNYEAIKSLVGLLVKKAGFDIDKNYSENELNKTKETIIKLENNNEDNISVATKKELIGNLKQRQASWENNAEVIGKSLLKCYKENKSYNEVRGKIEFLASLSKKDKTSTNENSLMSSIYDRYKQLEQDYKVIVQKIENNNYFNNEEKEVDLKLKDYLNHKFDSYKDDKKIIQREIDRLNDIEKKEQVISAKLKGYISNIKKDVESLSKLKKSSIDKGITIEVWEKIETIELGIKDKLLNASKIMKKTNKILFSIETKRQRLNQKNEKTDNDLKLVEKRLEEVNERINNNDYIDYASKIMDINNKEIIKLELEEIKNKKEVIYVDIDRVKEELIREWNRNKSNHETLLEDNNENIENEIETVNSTISEEINHEEIIEESNEDKQNIEEVIQQEEVTVIEEKQVDEIVEKKDRIELDW